MTYSMIQGFQRDSHGVTLLFLYRLSGQRASDSVNIVRYKYWNEQLLVVRYIEEM